ncbi:MAG: hypothetical protein CMO26_01880 [Thiotrichales bacterium]|nr:hypothetical protein [Thiotrichales bacterium]|tara:strand:- start:1294 stop:2265 length:972 start_codon:yes stop_codon:yes gene_type:complete
MTEIRGRFNYLAESVETSLLRNGKVLTRRDRDGSDAGTEGVEIEAFTMTITDARQLCGDASRTLKHNGFELQVRAMPDLARDFFDHRQVIEGYYPDCEQAVREATGTAHVYAFDHNIRSATGKKAKRQIAGGQQVQGPAHLVHGDYTLVSAPQRLCDLARPATGNDTLKAVLGDGESLIDPKVHDALVEADGRYAIINVWRSIAEQPVAIDPLALCDAHTVAPQDLVVFEIHYADRVGENYFAKHSDQHRWYTYPAMTQDEILLIKQWDSAGPLARSQGAESDHADAQAPCTFSFHSAFEDKQAAEDAPARWSIEVRCAVIYE